MLLLVLLGCVGFVVSQTTQSPVDCFDKEDGFAFWGCKAFHRCLRGVAEYVECGPGEVFDEAIGDCNSVQSVRTPCGMDLRDRCTDINGAYSRGVAIRDYEESVDLFNGRRNLRCTYFYICYLGRHFGTQKCSGGNVFDETQQFCVDPSTLAGECGLRNNNNNNNNNNNFPRRPQRPQRRG